MICARKTQLKFRTGCICFISNILLSQLTSSLWFCLFIFLLVFAFLLCFFTVFYLYYKDNKRWDAFWVCGPRFLLVHLCEIFPISFSFSLPT